MEDYFARIKCGEKEDSIIKDEWKVLPMSSELEYALEIKQCNEVDCKDIYERYNIPNIENGYYVFLDRHEDAVDKKSEEEINSRISYNYSVGIYDSDNMIIYYYDLDT